MSIGEYIAQLKGSPDTGHLFKDGAAPKSDKKAASITDTEEINPFLPESFNLTEQARIMRTDREFGVRLRDAAQAIAAEKNPFLSGNLTKQSEMLRDEPELALKMRDAAKPISSVNPWAGPKKDRNLTRQVIIVRSDPKLADKLKEEARIFNAANGYDKPQSLIFTPAPGSFRKSTGR
jgi:hypothetical protein